VSPKLQVQEAEEEVSQAEISHLTDMKKKAVIIIE
jgi:hypothetical protein